MPSCGRLSPPLPLATCKSSRKPNDCRMKLLTVRHVTTYRYKQPVSFGEHRMMFRPQESYDQRVLAFHLAISPAPSRLSHMQDVFGNCVGVARFDTRASELTFESRVELEHTPLPAFADLDDLLRRHSIASLFVNRIREPACRHDRRDPRRLQVQISSRDGNSGAARNLEAGSRQLSGFRDVDD